ncbi:MAG: hypothetical protein Q9214_001720, partial [Letrouitia sp. 1 TL-2023]
MEMQFRQLERAIESQPMPPQFQDTKAWIFCNDCNAKSALQILSSPTSGPASPGTINIPSNLEALNPRLTRRLRSNSRGRRTESNTYLHRFGYSVPAIPENAGSHNRSRRSFQSQSPHYPGQRSADWRSSISSDGSDSRETDDDEDYDDVDFWGGDDLNGRLGALALDEDARTIETSEEDEETDNDDQDSDNEDDEDYEDYEDEME